MAVWSLVISLFLICCGLCACLGQSQGNDFFVIWGIGFSGCVILYAVIFQAIALDWYSNKYRKSGEIGNSCDDILRLEMS